MFKIKDEIREKLQLVLVFLIMCVAFSIPFGDKYARYIMPLLFVFWLFYIKVEDIKILFKNKIIILIFAFISYHYISLFWSENLSGGFHVISQMWRYLFLPIVIYITIIKKDNIKYILLAFIFGMFVNEIISYLIYFDFYQTEFSRANGYPVGFINHIYYSILVAFCAILILYQSFNMNNIYLKILYSVFFITMTLNLVISGGRTGYVAYFATLIILLFTYYKFSIKNLIRILLFPTLIFYIGYKVNDDVQARFNASAHSLQEISNSNYNTSFGTRIAFYPLSYDMLNQEHNSFIFGIGTGDIVVELKKSILRTNLITGNMRHLHNIYLTAYTNAGIVALLLLLLIFFYLFRLKIVDKEMNFIKYLFLLIFVVSALSDNLLSTRVLMIYFSLFTAILLSQSMLEKENNEKNNTLST